MFLFASPDNDELVDIWYASEKLAIKRYIIQLVFSSFLILSCYFKIREILVKLHLIPCDS